MNNTIVQPNIFILLVRVTPGSFLRYARHWVRVIFKTHINGREYKGNEISVQTKREINEGMKIMKELKNDL